MMLALVTLLLFAALVLSAYADRVYSEMGKFLARAYQDNLDSWVELIEPRFGLSRDSLALSATVLRLTSVAALGLLLGRHSREPGVLRYVVQLLELALVVVVFDRLVPQLIFLRTRGNWVRRVRWAYQVLFYVVLPLTLLVGLLLGIAQLAEHEDAEEVPSTGEGVDALLEAGEEEGILEESDRALVRSVVEFGDMVVREVMTPRPEVFAIPDTTTLAEFTEQLVESAFSRVPVYHGSLDNITGIAFAHDLLSVTDEDAAKRTVREMQRPAAFTPEPKRVNELLREMQNEKQHMRIVIDEYGAVAGLVTIEDLLEAIVGNIEDEHDEPAVPHQEIQAEGDGVWVLPGNLDMSDLRDLLQAYEEQVEENEQDGESRVRYRLLPDDLESTTVGGLVSELAGHIPLPGEVVEANGLRLEVLASTARLVTRVRLLVKPAEAPQRGRE
ncbi:hemolysin family protein [Terriglobus aquaticus]|uniref:Hemolysin family protein n=1 Tax=Terriglobus aquaticus TaxID=940139 RepID=A0ABW9KML5_9BACT|nr:hemolysin family protein [Terriglobus aquaticus]